MIRLNIYHPPPILVCLQKQKKSVIRNQSAKVPSKHPSTAAALLWKWVRAGVWVERWIYHSTGWVWCQQCEKVRRWQLVHISCFSHSLGCVCSCLKAEVVDCESLQLHNFLRAIASSSPLNTSIIVITRPRGPSHHSMTPMNCVSLKVDWMLSPLPHRDGDIPAPENKGKHQPGFTSSPPPTHCRHLFLFSPSHRAHVELHVSVVLLLHTDHTMSFLSGSFFSV